MESPKEREAFSVIKRARSFTHAVRGIRIFIETTPNAWIHILLGISAVALGLSFHISQGDWFAIILSIGLVLVAEAINTAVEIDINLTSPDYHPYARDTKDVAAGAVLIASTIALVVGLIIFLPYVIPLF